MKKSISSFIMVSGLLALAITGCGKDAEDSALVIDIEGNSYNTVTIGEQVWMTENLKTKKYNDGSDIPVITDSTVWKNMTSEGLCWYKNESLVYNDPYGALYNGWSISTGKLCPTGWHVPSLEELTLLALYSGDTLTSGGNLKLRGHEYWSGPNTGADNRSGFSALGAGIRYFEGSFSSFSYFTCFWSATEFIPGELWFLSLYYDDAHTRLNHRNKNYGFSVRCIKD
jgi:uncharacterized protein (TIGR02145 family)